MFVTINRTADEDRLRGCIGYPYPIQGLGTALIKAAIGASCKDPRFPPLRREELQSVLVEVSVLTAPELVRVDLPSALPSMIRVGVDGLIVTSAGGSGLLLPQVASEFQLDAERFLSSACLKAGLSSDAWLAPDTIVHRFQAEVFSESSPGGEVGSTSEGGVRS